MQSLHGNFCIVSWTWSKPAKATEQVVKTYYLHLRFPIFLQLFLTTDVRYKLATRLHQGYFQAHDSPGCHKEILFSATA